MTDRTPGSDRGTASDGEDAALRVQRLPSNPDLELPGRATPGSAGYDLRSAEDTFDLEPGERRLVGTGLAIEMPDGMECQIRPRSGLAVRHGVTVLNSPGTVDPDYRGELRVLLVNLGSDPVRVERGERIAQAIFSRFGSPRVVETEKLSGSDRGDRGFGSTGRG